MKRSERPREAQVNVAPYSDGSGYQAVVQGWIEDGGPVFSIEITYRLDADKWPELQKAVEDVLRLLGEPS